jgi:threonine/homoserine/homoserine lactone efflux protein
VDLGFLLSGVIIGFSIAAPVGPIGVLCIRRTLAEGRTCGLVSGLGAATADAIYCCVAGFGVTFVSSFLISRQVWPTAAGGAFLCVLGIKTFLSSPGKRAASAGGNNLLGAYVSTFFLTLTNPLTILSFGAIFAGLGLAGAGGNYASAALLVIGVFTGSALWWLVLSACVGAFRQVLTPGALQWVNRISGSIITGFGLFALLRLMG